MLVCGVWGGGREPVLTMSRRPAMITQADVARALRAVEQTGTNAVVEITRDGTIRIVPAGNAGKTPEAQLDEVEPVDL